MFHCARALIRSLILVLLVAGYVLPAAAQVQGEAFDTEEQDPVRLSVRLQAPQGLYPGIGALNFDGKLCT
jgi:hypothetical protein